MFLIRDMPHSVHTYLGHTVLFLELVVLPRLFYFICPWSMFVTVHIIVMSPNAGNTLVCPSPQ